jgi:hypothetical protein
MGVLSGTTGVIEGYYGVLEGYLGVLKRYLGAMGYSRGTLRALSWHGGDRRYL